MYAKGLVDFLRLLCVLHNGIACSNIRAYTIYHSDNTDLGSPSARKESELKITIRQLGRSLCSSITH